MLQPMKRYGQSESVRFDRLSGLWNIHIDFLPFRHFSFSKNAVSCLCIIRVSLTFFFLILFPPSFFSPILLPFCLTLYCQGKCSVTFAPVHAVKAYMRTGGSPLLMVMWVTSFTPRPIYPRERTPVLVAWLSGPHGRSGRFRRRGKSVAFVENRILDRPHRGLVTITTPLVRLYFVFVLLVYLMTLSVAQNCQIVVRMEVFATYFRCSTEIFLWTLSRPRRLLA